MYDDTMMLRWKKYGTDIITLNGLQAVGSESSLRAITAVSASNGLGREVHGIGIPEDRLLQTVPINISHNFKCPLGPSLSLADLLSLSILIGYLLGVLRVQQLFVGVPFFTSS